MSVESGASEFDLPDGPEGPDYTLAVNELERSQTALFEAAAAWTRNPISLHRAQAFDTNIYSDRVAFVGFVEVVIGDDKLRPEEKARSISTIFKEVDTKRTKFFGSLVPSAAFSETSWYEEEFATSIQERLEDGEDPEEITDYISEVYAAISGEDTQRFLDIINMAPKMKALRLLKAAGERSVKIGEVAAAVAIGTLVAKRIEKRFD